MIDFTTILKQYPNGVLSTNDREKIKTRIFQYLFSDGNKVYFCTNTQKPVYEQLKKNPNVSFCTNLQNYSPVLSLYGKAVFVNNMSLKERAIDENPSIKNIYGDAQNPIFTIFYIDVKEIKLILPYLLPFQKTSSS